MSNRSNTQYHRFGDGTCHCIHREHQQPLFSKDPPDPLRTMPLGNSAPGVHLERQAGQAASASSKQEFENSTLGTKCWGFRGWPNGSNFIHDLQSLSLPATQFLFAKIPITSNYLLLISIS